MVMPFKKKREKAYFAKFSKTGNCLKNEVLWSVVSHQPLFRRSFRKSLQTWSPLGFLPDCRKRTRSRSMQCFNCVGIKWANDKTSYITFLMNYLTRRSKAIKHFGLQIFVLAGLFLFSNLKIVLFFVQFFGYQR